MSLETFEGPWEEVQAHIPEFVGHQVRVTVLDNEQAQESENALNSHNTREASPEEIQRRLTAFRALLSHPFQDCPTLSDQAMSRESIYDDGRLNVPH